MTTRILQASAGVLGLAGVVLGALGAHALKGRLSSGGHLDSWQTAVQYHLVHAVGLIAVVALMRAPGMSQSRPLKWAGCSWISGIVLFSGSLYGLALGGPPWLGPVTPLGGLAFLAGWILLLFSRPASAPKN